MKYYSEQLDEVFNTEEELKKAEKQYSDELEEANKIVAQYDEAVKFCQMTDKKITTLKNKLREDINVVNRERSEAVSKIQHNAENKIKELQDAYNKEVKALYESCSKIYDKACDTWLDYVFAKR